LRQIFCSKVYTQLGYNGQELAVEKFEVLLDDKSFVWEPASDGKVPERAVSTGKEGKDEIYIGRAPFQNSITIGKVKWLRNLFMLRNIYQC
jgi:Protein of unknown function (DUF3421)